MAKKVDKVAVNLYLDRELLERFDSVKRDFPFNLSRTDILIILLDFYEHHALQHTLSK